MNEEDILTEVAPLEHKQSREAIREQVKAEPCVWSARMLAALKSGVKGGKWFSLHDKCFSIRCLERAWEQVNSKGGCGGIDGVSLGTFGKHAEREIGKLHIELMAGTYQPSQVRRCWIPKAGSKEKRPLGIPTVRDRVVQMSLQMTLGPIFEIDFAEHSYGFRPNRGCKDALREVTRLLESGYEWVVDADIKQYFDNVRHDLLMTEIGKKIADGAILKLLEKFLKQGVMDSHKGWTPIKGTPQGAVISPLLSNIYLDGLDKEMQQQGYQMIRYADDFVILCETQQEAEAALRKAGEWLLGKSLQLHPEKTRIVHHYDKGGFEFLGYRFEAGKRFPRKRSEKKLKDVIRMRTKRSNGHSMQEIIQSLNSTLRGWFGYFKHSYRTTFRSIDGWIRMRLRSIYRKRLNKRGRGGGMDHHKWTNAHFAKMGLFSLEEAHRVACQSR